MSGSQFIMLPRELVEGDAWRGLGINARRLLDFLMIEHLRHGGKHNGYLLAPQRQLYEFGIGAHFVTAAIDEVERAGLVTCERGAGKRPRMAPGGQSWEHAGCRMAPVRR